MQILLIFTAFISLATASDWTGFKGCGLYKIDGVVRFKNNVPVMVVNETTKSEITLTVAIKNEPKLAPYIDQPISAQMNLTKPMNGSLGFGEVVEINSRLPHPLNPQDTGLHFVKSGECVK